ncbi:MAG: hypothetical protein HYX81_02065 [Chloroflexi bacterium]|nr:hypothetical protein [Chloroflexota bacterium]
MISDACELVEGRCECTNPAHQHSEGRCGKRLALDKRGQLGWGGWEACPIDGNPAHDTLSNCQVLCWDCRMRSP